MTALKDALVYTFSFPAVVCLTSYGFEGKSKKISQISTNTRGREDRGRDDSIVHRVIDPGYNGHPVV